MALTHYRNTTTQQVIADTQNAEQATVLQKKYSTTYYLSSLLFPKKIRKDIAVLYAFVRIPDEMVDNASSQEEACADIALWKEQWQQYVTVGGAQKSDYWIFTEMYAIHIRYGIPFDLSIAFIDAMIQDTTKARYANYAELDQYMYGSAAVVGRIITYMMGVSNEAVLREADKLGYAMQLTNFLRDIGEDYDLRNRIYMPQDELAQYNLSDTDIAEKNVTETWKVFMQFQVARNRVLYREANAALVHLPRYARTAIKAASILYEAQLDDIIENNYNSFYKYQKKAIIRKVTLLGKEAIISLWRKK